MCAQEVQITDAGRVGRTYELIVGGYVGGQVRQITFVGDATML